MTTPARHSIVYEATAPEQDLLIRMRAAGCDDELVGEMHDVFLMRALMRGVPFSAPVALYNDEPTREGLAHLVCDHYPSLVPMLPEHQRARRSNAARGAALRAKVMEK